MSERTLQLVQFLAHFHRSEMAQVLGPLFTIRRFKLPTLDRQNSNRTTLLDIPPIFLKRQRGFGHNREHAHSSVS